ncbi:hypothetical protein NDI76_19425 [Halogeometricum sp. S1BR25-6]|uniref:Restriction endonuclease type IV Mrr domain-containing protein n=1 Tax=Halogeometricum salsisoli TaxID=2950536 RepID=A0ABU2GJC9_9EURY|nr:hypothetical protein [Halogeometricum sp. S1BR25-6]MDS0300922.1 hypothetical protein [Halogeometricum sp. S1BR25-6]
MTDTINIDTETGTVRFEDFTVADNELATFLAEQEEDALEDAARHVVRIGAATLSLAETSKEVEHVKREFDQMRADFDEELDTVKDELDRRFGDDGEVSAILDRHLGSEGRLARELDDVFGDNGRLARRLDEELGEDGERIQTALDPDRDGTPTNRLRETIRSEIRELATQLEREDAKEEGRDEVRERTTEKGYIFEDQVDEFLTDLVYGSSHSVERTSETVGELTDSKVGDFVLTLGTTEQRIVVEAKSEQNYTQPKIKSEMREAIENRDADYGIFVSECESYVPNKVGYLREFDGEFLSVALCADEDDEVDPRLLHVGFNWAEMRAIQTHVEAGDDIDAEFVRTQVEEVEDSVRKFSNIKRECSNLKQSANSIEESLDSIQGEVTTRLNNIVGEMSKSDSAPDK